MESCLLNFQKVKISEWYEYTEWQNQDAKKTYTLEMMEQNNKMKFFIAVRRKN